MTTLYTIKALCVRSFKAWIDLPAETPHDALDMVREVNLEMIAAADDLGKWPWDEFAVYDQRRILLLNSLDEEARLRHTASALLAACQMVVAAAEGGDLTDAIRACRAAVNRFESYPATAVNSEVEAGVVSGSK